MTKGIIIIATKSHLYGRMAYNLAVTIKATKTEIPVALVYDGGAAAHLTDAHLGIFDHLIPTEWDWNKVRFNIDRISPFDLTLQLDADMLWLWRDPEELFAAVGESELLVTNEGYFDIEANEEHLTGNYIWLADRDATVSKYKLKGKFYQMRWELLFFRKTERVRKMFAMAEGIRKKPKLEVMKFEGQTVDEFAFAVAANHCGLDQASAPYVPAYWCKRNSNPTVGKLNKDYFAVGFGGNSANDEYRRIYDIIMQVAAPKLGLKHTFKLRSKRHYLTSRIPV